MGRRIIISVHFIASLFFAVTFAQQRAPAGRTGYWDVCGPSNLYSTDYQICCGDRIYQNLRGDIDCCNGVAFNRTLNFCFNNNEIRAVGAVIPPQQPFISQPVMAPAPMPVVMQPSAPAQMMIPAPAPIMVPAPAPMMMPAPAPIMMQQPQQPPALTIQGAKPSSGYRCGTASVSANVAESKTTLCCGNVVFDARFQLCSDFGPAPIQAAGIQGAMTVSAPEKFYTCGLDQVPSSAVTSFDTAYCCGTVVYDSRYYTCTRNNAVVPQGPFSQQPGVSMQPQQPPVENRPRPSAYPAVADGFTRVRCLSNLFDVPTNHMTYYSCCGSQAFDERYFVCTSTGSGSPRAQPINQANQQSAQQPIGPSPGMSMSFQPPVQQQPQLPSATPRTSTQLQCGKRIYLFGPPTYGAYMQCCGEDVFDVRTDTCIGGTKVTGGAQPAGKKRK